jgi:glucose-6-phosphate 1-epimerase
LKVGDAMRVSVPELDRLSYSDKFDDFNVHTQRGAWHLNDPRDPGRSDRIYMNAPDRFELLDPTLQRKVILETQGSKTLVAWNPGEEAVKGFADIPAASWRDYVCLETANCGPEVIELGPDDSHMLRQTISVEALQQH